MFTIMRDYVVRCLIHLFSTYFITRTENGGWVVPVFFDGEYGELVLHEKMPQLFFPPSRYCQGETTDDHRLKMVLRYNLQMNQRLQVWNDKREEIEIEC